MISKEIYKQFLDLQKERDNYVKPYIKGINEIEKQINLLEKKSKYLSKELDKKDEEFFNKCRDTFLWKKCCIMVNREDNICSICKNYLSHQESYWYQQDGLAGDIATRIAWECKNNLEPKTCKSFIFKEERAKKQRKYYNKHIIWVKAYKKARKEDKICKAKCEVTSNDMPFIKIPGCIEE